MLELTFEIVPDGVTVVCVWSSVLLCIYIVFSILYFVSHSLVQGYFAFLGDLYSKQLSQLAHHPTLTRFPINMLSWGSIVAYVRWS
jgi:hypothetical protein